MAWYNSRLELSSIPEQVVAPLDHEKCLCTSAHQLYKAEESCGKEVWNFKTF